MKRVDEYFTIGLQHRADGKPCQDHSLSGHDAQEHAYVSIADGCSSGGATDMGARIVNYATMQAIKNMISWRKKYDLVADMVMDVASQRLLTIDRVHRELHMQYEDLLATNIYIFSSQEHTYAHVVGDGFIAVAMTDGYTEVWRYFWADNTPYYPAYDLGKQEQFIIAHGADGMKNCLTEEQWVIGVDGQVTCVGITEQTILHGMRGVTIDLTEKVRCGLVKTVAIFSDGAELVDGLTWQQVIVQSMAYKNITGAFVKRRMMRLMRDTSKEYKGPLDDIACAAIHFS